MYYFAYGSNMNHKQMKNRCPKSRYLTKAKLVGYKFVYDGYSKCWGGAVANIIVSKNYFVEGGLFEVDDECINILDKYEGYPNSYQRNIVDVIVNDGKVYKALVYFRNPLKPGEPSDQYRATILQGARDCDLSEGYIKEFLQRSI